MRRPALSPERIERGVKILSLINFDAPASGSIVAEPRYTGFSGSHRSEPDRSAYSLRNVIRVSDFVMTDGDDREILRIARRTRFPSRFDILQQGETGGTIEMRGLLRSRSVLKLASGRNWTFWMPPFSLDFFGESDDGLRIWAQVGPSGTQWNLLVEPDAHDVRLVAWLTFLHRRWWCYG